MSGPLQGWRRETEGGWKDSVFTLRMSSSSLLEALGWAPRRTQAGRDAAYPPGRGEAGCVSPWHLDLIYRGDRVRRQVIKDIAEDFMPSSFQGEEPRKPTQGPTGKPQGQPAPRREGRAWPRSPIVASEQGSGEVGSALAGSSNSSWLWATRHPWSSSYLAGNLGPGDPGLCEG